MHPNPIIDYFLSNMSSNAAPIRQSRRVVLGPSSSLNPPASASASTTDSNSASMTPPASMASTSTNQLTPPPNVVSRFRTGVSIPPLRLATLIPPEFFLSPPMTPSLPIVTQASPLPPQASPLPPQVLNMVRSLLAMDPEEFSSLMDTFVQDPQEDDESDESDEQFAERLQQEEFMTYMLNEQRTNQDASPSTGETTENPGTQNEEDTEDGSSDSSSDSDSDSDSDGEESSSNTTSSNTHRSNSSSSSSFTFSTSGSNSSGSYSSTISTHSGSLSDLIDHVWSSYGMNFANQPNISNLSSMSFDAGPGLFNQFGTFSPMMTHMLSPNFNMPMSGNTYETLLRLNEMFPPVNRSVKDETLETLPEVKCQETGKACSICLTDFELDETCLQLPKCGHLFHGECVKTWLKINKVCPTCRKDVEDENDDES